ncbi:hypothetical protein OSB04_000889 [Centaurea solstitialis]|uniref:Transmembrane protein n=1 Tax=Centaurea solstitialis TaxID=347529 RepID=A0AA38U9B0_9ASTR|nr:hypothetical protein OSB04_000889 [Centaurea solstitialis]
MPAVTEEQWRPEVEEVVDTESGSFNPWLVKKQDTSNNPPPPPVVCKDGDSGEPSLWEDDDCDDEQMFCCGDGARWSNTIETSPNSGAPATEEGSVSLEVLKSIVYGGLTVVIASFSVVAAAAAADTPTVNIVALALASVLGGIFAIGRTLWDLRDDCYKGKQEATNKYKELLGRLNYFPLHAVFAILSFVIFGMVPPVTYGFSYRETGDEDHTIVVVAIVSLFCVSLLAILKAYVTRCKRFFLYVKTVVYNVAIAVLVSGASYVAGILVSRLIKELGLFDLSSGVATTLLPRATAMSLSS